MKVEKINTTLSVVDSIELPQSVESVLAIERVKAINVVMKDGTTVTYSKVLDEKGEWEE